MNVLKSVVLMLAMLVLADVAEARRLVVATGSGEMAGAISVAIARGFCAEERVDVAIRPYSNSFEGLKGMLRGEADLVAVNRTGFVLADPDPQRVCILAMLSTTENQTKILCRQKSGINSMRDLLGKKIGVVYGSSGHYYLDAFLEAHGLNPQKLRIVEMKKKEMPCALATGEIDAMAQHGVPTETALRLMRGQPVIIFCENGIDVKTAWLVSTRQTAREQAGKIKRLLRAIEKGNQYIPRRPYQASRLISSIRGQSYTGVLNYISNEIRYTLKEGRGHVRDFSVLEEWAEEHGYLERRSRRNYSLFWEPKLLRDAFPGEIR